MNRVYTIVKGHVKTWFRSKSTIFWTLLFPILLIVLFGAIFGNGNTRFDLYVQNQDLKASTPTQASVGYVTALNQTGAFNLRLVAAEVSNPVTFMKDDAQLNNRGQRLLVIPSGFQNNLTAGSHKANVTLYMDMSDQASASLGGIIYAVTSSYGAHRSPTYSDESDRLISSANLHQQRTERRDDLSRTSSSAHEHDNSTRLSHGLHCARIVTDELERRVVTHPTAGRRHLSQLSNNRACLFGTASVLFSFFFVVALLAVHVLEPEMNQGSLSFYSLGPYGLIMRLGFIALGLAFYFLVLGLNLLPGAGNFRYVDLLLLLIAGTGLLLIGVFDADGLGASSTISGNVHRLSANAWSLGAAFGAFFLRSRVSSTWSLINCRPEI